MTTNITLIQLKELFLDFQKRHKFLNDFYFGAITELSNTHQYTYPLMGVIPGDIQISPSSNQNRDITFNFNIIFADLVQAQVDNRDEVRSDTIQFCQDFISEIDMNAFYRNNNISIVSSTLSPFEERFTDLTTGYVLQLTLSTPFFINNCNAPVDKKVNGLITGPC